jgi:2-iminobutanoate/2-iminopropanoate deaminase
VATVKKKIAVSVGTAPNPTGPFNHAICYGNLVFTSGQAGRNRETGLMGDVADQARRCIGNISAILTAAGSSLEHVLKVTVFLRNPADRAAFNAVYEELMPRPYPARTAAFCELGFPDMLVEMDVIAAVPE